MNSFPELFFSAVFACHAGVKGTLKPSVISKSRLLWPFGGITSSFNLLVYGWQAKKIEAEKSDRKYERKCYVE